MKKINGISLLHGIAILSSIGIVGIFAWCNESITIGGKGFTPTLLFAVYALLLLACNAEICATEESFERAFARTKKVYDIAKNKATMEGVNLYNFDFYQRWKIFVYVSFGVLMIALWLVIHNTLIKNLILALLASFGLSYLLLALFLVAWNLAIIRRLNKIRNMLTN